jgi:hypothetical protein
LTPWPHNRSQHGRAHARLDRLLDSLKQQGAENLGALLVGDRFERCELSAFPCLLGWR